MTPFSEIKHRLADGSVAEYACHLLHREPGHVVLYHKLVDGGAEVFGIKLRQGTETFGYFWEDRLYNVYHWVQPEGDPAGFYFNLADGTEIGPDYVEWRDLVVDVLITPDGRCQVLDEDELPGNLTPGVRQKIEEAKVQILENRRALIEEIVDASRHWLLT